MAVQDERVDTLPTGTARLVEVARALAARPRLLLLDEPSAGLNEGETTELGFLLVALAETGLGVLLVEHDMRFVMGTCSHIHVLDFGQIIASGAPDAIQANAGGAVGLPRRRPRRRSRAAGAARRRTRPRRAGRRGSARRGRWRTRPIVRPRARRRRPTDADASSVPPALELGGVTGGYGTIDVLYGVDLVLRQGRGARAARAQRCGEVDHAQGGERPDQAQRPATSSSTA